MWTRLGVRPSDTKQLYRLKFKVIAKLPRPSFGEARPMLGGGFRQKGAGYRFFLGTSEVSLVIRRAAQ